MPAIEKGDALTDYLIAWIDVEPEQPLGGTTKGHTQLIDGQALSQIFDLGIGSQAAIVAKNALDVAAGIEYTNRVKVQPLGFRDSEHRAASGFGNVGRNRIFQCDQRQALAGGERNE